MEPDGYCHSCGHRQPGPRDRVELTDGSVVAISDRGQRHHHNEDAVAIADVGGDAAVLVVCDGVSSTPGSAEISSIAAEAAAAVLVDAAADTAPPDGMAVSDDALERAAEAAQVEAGAASLAMEIDELNPPSTTLVAVAARALGESVAVSVVWLGDSRAYWLSGHGAHLLTVDHEVDGALTRWVGIDAASHAPQTSHRAFPAGEGGDLIVCTDGMWRYFAPDTGEPAPTLVNRLSEDGLTDLDLARAMVDFANEQGGHDNISVAYWSPGSRSTPARSTVEDPATADSDPPKDSVT